MSNDYMADLCDKLLGVDRNDPLTMKITKKVKFSDPDVCKPFLVGFCPHLTFSNTKSDVGPCPRRIHEDSLRDDFYREGERYRNDYEVEFFGILHRMIQDLQRKIKKAQSRLEARPTSEAVEQLLNPEKDEFEERRAIVDVQIKALIQKMEEFVERGKMKEVQEINGQLEVLRAEMMRIKMAEESNPLVKQDKKMEVCQVCGSLLIMNDVQKRLEAHFEGKQHAGFVKVWEYFEQYKKKYPDVFHRLEGFGSRRVYPANRRPRSPPRHGYAPRHRSPSRHEERPARQRSPAPRGRHSDGASRHDEHAARYRSRSRDNHSKDERFSNSAGHWNRPQESFHRGRASHSHRHN